MATAISLANFQAACGEVYDAIESESWADAYKWYAKAEAQNSGLELSLSDQGSTISRRHALDGLKKALEAAQSVMDRRAETSRQITTQTSHNI